MTLYEISINPAVFRAGNWAGGSYVKPDQGEYMADQVSYFGRTLTRDEVRDNVAVYRAGLKKLA